MDKGVQDMSGTIGFVENQMRAQIQATWIKFGMTLKEEILPVIIALTEKIKELGNWFKELDPPARNFYTHLVKWMAIIGPLTLAFSFLTKMVLPALLSILRLVIGAFRALQAAIFLSPTSAVVVALIAAFGLIFGATRKLKKGFDEAREAKEALDKKLAIEANLAANPGVAETAELTRRTGGVAYMAKDELTSFKKELTDRFDIEKKEYEKQQAYMERLNRYMVKNQIQTDEAYGKQTAKYFEASKNLAAVRKKNMTELLQDIQKVDAAMKALLAAFEPTGTLEDAETLAKILDEYKMKVATSLQKDFIFGTSRTMEGMNERLSAAKVAFDALSEYQYKTGDSSQELANKMLYLTGVIKILETAINNAKDATQEFSKLQRIIDAYQGAIGGINEAMMSGDYYNEMDAVRDKIRAAETALRQLYKLAETSGWSDALRNEINNVTDDLKEFKEQLSQLEVTAVMVEALSQSFFALGQSMVEGKSAWVSFAQSMLSMLAQIVAAKLVETFVTIFSASATIAQKAVAKAGLPGLAIAAVGIGALMALMSSAKLKSKSVAKMAEGGVIPSGYPNDTYPALLTSGETVLPPGQLSLSRGTVNINLDAEVHGRKLKWVLRNYEAVLNEQT
jgi:hypothetical protein